MHCRLCDKKINHNNTFNTVVGKEPVQVCYACYLKIKRHNDILREQKRHAKRD